SVTAALAELAAQSQNVVLADCNVEAPALQVLLEPAIRRRGSVGGAKRAFVDARSCTACGSCAAACRYDAISMTGPVNDRAVRTAQVDPLACEGCLACLQVCSANAIRLRDVQRGEWFTGETRFGLMVYARLRPG